MPNQLMFLSSKMGSALLSLGIVFVIFFTLAFACGNGRSRPTPNYPQETPAPYTPSRPPSTRSGSPTEADIKAYVTEYEEELHPTGYSSSEPESMTITFGQIRFETPRPANTGDKVRKVESDYLYPVVVKYTLNMKFSDGTYPTPKSNKFELYRNAQGGWSAFQYGPAD